MANEEKSQLNFNYSQKKSAIYCKASWKYLLTGKLWNKLFKFIPNLFIYLFAFANILPQ